VVTFARENGGSERDGPTRVGLNSGREAEQPGRVLLRHLRYLGRRKSLLPQRDEESGEAATLPTMPRVCVSAWGDWNHLWIDHAANTRLPRRRTV
jgi:hypothetical protein